MLEFLQVSGATARTGEKTDVLNHSNIREFPK